MIKKDKIDKNSHEYKTGFRDGIEYANEKLKEDGTFFQRIHDLISYDISTIWDEQGKGQDGMYSLNPCLLYTSGRKKFSSFYTTSSYLYKN